MLILFPPYGFFFNILYLFTYFEFPVLFISACRSKFPYHVISFQHEEMLLVLLVMQSSSCDFSQL